MERSNLALEKEKDIMNPRRLFNRDFLLLWVGQAASAFGDAVHYIAMAWWIMQTFNSPIVLGNTYALLSAPRVLIGPIAGAVVDRSNRKWIIVGMDLIRGLVITSMAIMAINDKLTKPYLYLFSVIISLSGAFFTPAVNASIPLLVHKKHLTRANSLYSISRPLFNLLGPGIGGLLIAKWGAPIVFLINGITFFASGVTEMFIRIPKRNGLKHSYIGFLKSIKEGFTYIFEKKQLRAMVLGLSFASFFIGPIDILLPKYVQSDLSLSAAHYGLVVSIFSLGFIASSGILALIPNVKRPATFITIGIFSMGILLIMTTWQQSFYYLMGTIFCVGTAFAIVNILINVQIQTTVPDNMRGRVFSLLETFIGTLTPVSLAMGGYFLNVLTSRQFMILMGLGVAIGGFVYLKSRG